MKIIDSQGRKIDLQSSFLETGLFGDGSDSASGDPILDSNHTSYLFGTWSGSTFALTRSIYCANLTIASGITLNTAGFRIFCTGTLTNNGTISNAGAAGVTGITGGAGGAGGAALPNNNEVGGSSSGGTGGAGASSTGATGAIGSNNPYMMGGTGNAGGAGGTGSSGHPGGATASGGAVNYKPFRALTSLVQSGLNLISGGAGGAGGGGGGGNGTGLGVVGAVAGAVVGCS